MLQTAFLGTLCFGPLLGIGLAVLLLGFMLIYHSVLFLAFIAPNENVYVDTVYSLHTNLHTLTVSMVYI